jgi:hypothetical protein
MERHERIHREQGDLISLISFFPNKEITLKGTMLNEFLVTRAWHVLGLLVKEMEYIEYM